MKDRIVNKVSEMFFAYGVKSVTMDDIARELGISKRTVYQHFTDKAGIASEIIDRIIDGHASLLCDATQNAPNAIQEVLVQVEILNDRFSPIKPGFYYELRKYFPMVWQKLLDFKSNVIATAIKTNLERGISEGLYRKELDLGLICTIRLGQLDSVFSNDLFPDAGVAPRRMLLALTEMYLFGIVTDEGRSIINENLTIHNK